MLDQTDNSIEILQSGIDTAVTAIEKIILGKPVQIRLAVCCLLARGHCLIEDLPGVGGQCTWHAFAEEIIQRSRLAVPVDAISSDELDRPARRPPWSVLDTGLYSRCTGHVLRSWQDALGAYLATREPRTDVPHTSDNH